MMKGKEKASTRDRKDPAWKYSVQVEIEGGEKTYIYLRCNFCEKVVKGGVTRMKEHLSCSHKNVAPCSQVPDMVKEEIRCYMGNAKKSKILAQQQFDDRVNIGSYFGSFKGSSTTVSPQVGRGVRGVADTAERSKADVQLIDFRNREGFFGLQQAKDTVSIRTPVEWWIQFGDGTPELQSFAIRVLGLTCSSSGCERNWSMYNQVHTKRRNRLSTLRMNSLVYIMYNRKLKEKNLRKKQLREDIDPLICDDIASDDDWFVDDVAEEITTLQLQQEDLAIDLFTLDRSTSSSHPTGKRKVVEIEECGEEEDLADLESSDDGEKEKDIPYADDSNEDPLSDDSEE